MKYIFFDIECANCFDGHGKMCSFGYVITDEQFNVIKKEDIIINPRSRFYLAPHKNRPNIVLAYNEEQFKSAPVFPLLYNKIRSVLSEKDAIIFGFSVIADACYIKSECERYKKDHFDYKFIDVQRIYTDVHNLTNTPSLIHCASEYEENQNQDIHKSDDDALLTMKVLKGLCAETGLLAKDIIEKYPYCKCEIKNGEISSEYTKYKEALKAQKLSKMEVLTQSLRSNWIYSVEENYKKFTDYIKKVYINKYAPSPLCGKTFCISNLYEDYHFNEMMNIVSILAKNGAKYTKCANLCQYFVKFELNDKNGKEYKCYRYAKAMRSKEDGRGIKFISFEEFIAMLPIDGEEDLCAPYKNNLSSLKRCYALNGQKNRAVLK